MRKSLLLFCLLLPLFFAFPVKAQGEIQLGSVSVDIWPEYDQPAVLMIYRISLPAGTSLPANLNLAIPSNAQINAVADVDPQKGLLNTPFETSIQANTAILKFTTNFPQVQLEYYLPLEKDGTTRHIVFKWAGDYAVEKMDLNFLKPFGAENLSLSLTPNDTQPGQDGLTNYHFQKTNLAAKQLFDLAIDYQRQTDDLSITSQPVQAVTTPGPKTPGRASMSDIWPYALLGLGVLLIVAVVIWFNTGQRPKLGKRVHQKSPPPHSESQDQVSYCPNCGKRAQSGDVFCRTCGTRLGRGSED